MDNYIEIWQETLEQVKDSMPESLHSFFDNINYNGVEGNTLNLSVASPFMLANLNKYKDSIANTFAEKAGDDYTINISVDSTIKSKPATSVKKAPVKAPVKSIKQSSNTTLNKKYSFDNFVYGENSDLAFKAAKIIALNPGTSFNPCLIYGGVGLGKTHLLQAIGNYIDEHDPAKKVIYVTAESFTNEFISCFGAGEGNTLKNRFKQKYRKTDVLLIDDIHFLQKKDGIQVDLRPPQYEVRMAIAKQKCKELKLEIPDETLDFICQSVKTNVRDLEGALTTVSAVAQIIEKPATIELAKEHLKDILIEPALRSAEYTIDDIFTVTSNYFNVSIVDLKGNSRSKNIKQPRQIAIYYAYKYGKFTQSEIGTYLNKDHTSIGYTIKTMEAMIDNDDSLKNAINSIRSKLEEK